MKCTAATSRRPGLRGRKFNRVTTDVLRSSAAGKHLMIQRLASTSELLAVPLDSAGVDSPTRLFWDPQCALCTERFVDGPYEVVLPAHPAAQGPLCVPPTPQQRARLLEVPQQIDRKVVELAKEVAGTGPPADRVWKIQQHLRQTHAYSLSYAPQGEPLTDFILNGRAAHCQYFGSALVMMARAAGVPARFVTGFYAHEAAKPRQMVVRERDAHAWAECWIDGVGWITADATPASGRPDGMFTEPSRWRRWWEHLQDVPGAIRDWLSGPGQRIMLLIALPVMAAFIAWLVPLAWQGRQRREMPAAYPESNAELAAAAQRFDQWLRRRGVPCASARTWREHLFALAGNGSGDARTIDHPPHLLFAASQLSPPAAPGNFFADASTSGQPPRAPVDLGRCNRFVVLYEKARFGGGDQQLMARIHDSLNDLEQHPLEV